MVYCNKGLLTFADALRCGPCAASSPTGRGETPNRKPTAKGLGLRALKNTTSGDTCPLLEKPTGMCSRVLSVMPRKGPFTADEPCVTQSP